jgi:hypothetical protein
VVDVVEGSDIAHSYPPYALVALRRKGGSGPLGFLGSGRVVFELIVGGSVIAERELGVTN